MDHEVAIFRRPLAPVVLALTFGALFPEPSFAVLVGAYLVSWCLLNLWADRARATRTTAPRPNGRQFALGASLLLLVPLSQWVTRGSALFAHEQLTSIGERVAARMRLERSPSIAPPLVSAAEPQAFYVSATPGAVVALRLGADGPELAADELMPGVYRIDYSPVDDGLPDPPDGALSATITVDGTAHAREMRSVRPGAHPRWLRASPSRHAAAAVSEETDELVVVGSEGLMRRVSVGDGPSDVVWISDEEVVVAHRYADALLRIRVRDGEIVRRYPVGGRARHLDYDGHGVVWLSATGESQGLLGVSLADGATERIPLPVAPDWVAVGTSAEQLVFSSVRPPALHYYARDDGRWVPARAPITLGRPPTTMAVDAARERVIVALTDLRLEGAPHLGNHYVQDHLAFFDLRDGSLRRDLLTARRTPRQRMPGDVDSGLGPMGLDPQPDGSVHVVFSGSNELWTIPPDGAPPHVWPLGGVPLPAPHGVAHLGDDRMVLSSPAAGRLVVLRHDEAVAQLVDLRSEEIRPDGASNESRLRERGELAFYEATRSGASCQSCHLHADSDGARHNIGSYELVGTLSVRGLLGTPPYLRDGSYASLGRFNELATGIFRGYLRHERERARVLTRYVESLPRLQPVRRPSERDEARERLGAAHFEEAGCGHCHAAPAFTNLGAHPASSIFPAWNREERPGPRLLDVPSLLSVGSSAPYLKDGRAATLHEVLTRYNEDDRHGVTSHLTESQIADLVYFLEGL